MRMRIPQDKGLFRIWLTMKMLSATRATHGSLQQEHHLCGTTFQVNVTENPHQLYYIITKAEKKCPCIEIYVLYYSTQLNFFWSLYFPRRISLSPNLRKLSFHKVHAIYYLELKFQWVKCCLLLMNRNVLYEVHSADRYALLWMQYAWLKPASCS